MRTIRASLLLVLLVLMNLGVPAARAAAARWTLTGALQTPHFLGATVTLLPSGLVLLAGGQGPIDFSADAELYDPRSGRWRPTAPMHEARDGQTATLLRTGEVLVAGGTGNGKKGASIELASAELYTPATGRWRPTGSMHAVRDGQTATLLPDGRVLVAGGAPDIKGCELYDPRTGRWSETGPMLAGRLDQQAVLLTTGKVLAIGGFHLTHEGYSSADVLASAELYDPRTGSWSMTGSMIAPRYAFTATVLQSGRVLVASYGEVSVLLCQISIGPCPRNTSAELYDPGTGTWQETGPMVVDRGDHTATLLADGRVLVAGGSGGVCGNSNCAALASAEVYDPRTNRWTPTASMHQVRELQDAVRLDDGRVLVIAGDNGTFDPILPVRGEVYTP